MPTVLELIQKTTSYLTEKGVPQARLDAEWMLARVLGYGRMQLYLEFERPLNEEMVTAYREMVRRRGKREPLQYILGETPFGDCRIRCDQRALIPRPETEELADLLARRLRSTPEGATGPFLDLGTGTGALALLLATWFPEATVHGVDRSPEALALARENALLNDLATDPPRLHWWESNWFAQIPPATRYRAIVANPPYLTQEEWNTAEPEVRSFEPTQALIARDEGKADLHIIIRQAPDYLLSGGWLALETGLAHPEALRSAFSESLWSSVETLSDASRRPRFLLAQRR